MEIEEEGHPYPHTDLSVIHCYSTKGTLVERTPIPPMRISSPRPAQRSSSLQTRDRGGIVYRGGYGIPAHPVYKVPQRFTDIPDDRG